MLKQIVFLIVDETQVESAEKLKSRIDGKGDWIHIWGTAEENLVNEAKAESDMELTSRMECRHMTRGEEPRCLKDYERETTLFVTDVSLILRELRRQERYAIAFLHPNNGSQDWSGAGYMITDIEELEADSFVKAYQRMTGEPWTILETKRCIIRETTVADVDEFYRIYAEPSITYYMDNLYEQPEQERAYAQEYIEKVYSFYGYGMWSIVNKETGRVMGRAGLSWREGYEIPELGFVIEAAYQQMGYAYEVCKAIMEYGEEELGFTKIQALVKAENEASVRLCRKLGFEKDGEVEERGEMYDKMCYDGSMKRK